MAPTNTMNQDIGPKELDLSLDKILSNQITLDGAFGKKIVVPVYFRDRESKMIPDTTSTGGMIWINFVMPDRADAAYWNQDEIREVLKEDSEGNPTKYKIYPAPTPYYYFYNITARTSDLKDMVEIQTQLDKIFPVTHRHLDVNGTKVQLFREGFNNADLPELGIFQREWNLKILGYLFSGEKPRIVDTVKEIILEAGPTTDPDAGPEFFETVEICNIVTGEIE